MAKRPPTKKFKSRDAIQNVRSFITASISLMAGTMINAIPFYASAWIIAALAVALLYSHIWSDVTPKARKIWALVLTMPFLLFTGMAVRAFIGANYTLKYKVCGQALQEGQLVKGVALGIEWHNDSNEELYVRNDSAVFTAGDKSSIFPVSNEISVVKPSSKNDLDVAMGTSWVTFSPPIDPPEILKGRVHYVFSFGTDKQNPGNTLVIDGTYRAMFSQDRTISDFRFSPSNETSHGYVGTCDINPQIDAY